MGNKAELAADMLRRIGEDITQYAGVLNGMESFGNCDAREIGDVFMKRIAVWKALVSDLPPCNDRHRILASDAEFKADGYKMVDLGLPSGLKWADRNIGAESPEAYGDYFMWGSTTPDTNNVCDWAHSPFNDGSEKFDEAYFNEQKSEWVTENGTLKPEYDTAHKIMGGDWRMPTSAEMRELIDVTTQSVETLNGVKGMRFTSVVNGNSIFMPFAGMRKDSYTNDAGDFCFAWSSSLHAGEAYYSLYLHFDSDEEYGVYNYGRLHGFVVRGVHE